MTFQPGQVIRTSEGQVFTVVVHRTPLSFGSHYVEGEALAAVSEGTPLIEGQ